MPNRIYNCTLRIKERELTPVVSKLILHLLLLLLYLLLCLSRSARNLCQRVCISLSHMGHHWQEEDSAGGRCLCRFMLRRLSRHRWSLRIVYQ